MSQAIRIASLLGLTFAAIDFLVTKDGTPFILEANSAPGLERFHEPNEGPAFDAMRAYLELIVQTLANT